MGKKLVLLIFTFLLRGKSFKEFGNCGWFQIDSFMVRSLLMMKYFPDNLFEYFHPLKHYRHQGSNCFLQRSSIRSNRLPITTGYAQSSELVATNSISQWWTTSLEKGLLLLLLIQLMASMFPVSNSIHKSPPCSHASQSISFHIQSILLPTFFLYSAPPYCEHLTVSFDIFHTF